MDSAKKKVFIIEDDPFLVKAYKFIFEKENLEVWVAKDGEEAVSFMGRSEMPDIVLLDLMLPGMSGFDVLAAIRTNPGWKNLAVMIITNLGQPKDIERGKSLGAVDYLVKSNTNIDDIVSGVRHYLHMA